MSPTSIALLGYLAALSVLLPHCLVVHSLANVDFIYSGFQQAANLSLDGSASVLRGGALQLTNDSNSIIGHAFFDSPVQVIRGNNSVVSFSTTFVFDIVTADNHGGGHGLAFVMSASKVLPGASDGIYLGLLGESNNGNSSNHVFVVEFDTLQVRRLNETNSNHVGVDLNSLVSNVSEPAAYFDDNDDGKNISVALESGQPIQAWVDYDGGAKVLNVTIAPTASVTSRPRKPLISTVVDLQPIFKQDMYVGFSSSTGEKLASSHYILAWSFRTDGAAKPIDISRLPKVPKRASLPPSISTVVKITALSCVFTLTVIVAVTALAVWIRRRTAMAETLEDWELDHPHRLPYKELYTATKGFDASELLGAGGFGQVYRGVLRRSGDVVAIKRISSSGAQGLRTFVAEVASLGRMRHRNLVDLRGWCKRGQDLLLVYEFMPNGSLDEHLFGRAGAAMPPKPLLAWEQRVRILRGVASGLVYLHEEWEQVVVHRDVKASNVPLGADMSPRLGDFGLARLYEHGAKSDLVRAVDERLDGRYDKEEAKLVLWLGLMCSQSRPEARPSMRQACQYLDRELEMQEVAVLAFPDVDSVDDVGSLASMTWSSCVLVQHNVRGLTADWPVIIVAGRITLDSAGPSPATPVLRRIYFSARVALIIVVCRILQEIYTFCFRISASSCSYLSSSFVFQFETTCEEVLFYKAVKI